MFPLNIELLKVDFNIYFKLFHEKPLNYVILNTGFFPPFVKNCKERLSIVCSAKGL